jgi:hypothetical protein
MKSFLTFIIAFIAFFGSFSLFAQESKREVQNYANITIAVINSNRTFHIATVRYFDQNGDILINTSEEFKIDISKSPRFATGSIRKSIPVYPDAKTIEVTVTNCTNMHENVFILSELAASNNEVTFVFQGKFEGSIQVEFEGVSKEKPGTFLIKGANTNKIFYADYNNVKVTLPDEADVKDVKVELSKTSLFQYKISGTEKDKKTGIVKVKCELIEDKESGDKKGKK